MRTNSFVGKTTLTPERPLSFTLPTAVITAKNPHPERHAGVVRWKGRPIFIPFRFSWATDHAATTIRPAIYRKWDEAAGTIYKFGLIAASAALGGVPAVIVGGVTSGLPNDMGKDAVRHDAILVPKGPTASSPAKPLSTTIKALKFGVDQVKKKLEECIELNRKAGPARGSVERGNEAAMAELLRAYTNASDLLKWAGIVPPAIEYLAHPTGSNAVGLISSVASTTLARIEAVAAKAVAQNEAILGTLSKRAAKAVAADNEWLGSISKVAKLGGFIVQIAGLVYDLYSLRDATAGETLRELTFNTMAFTRYNTFIKSHFQAGNTCWYLQLFNVGAAFEAEAYAAVLHESIKMRVAPQLGTPGGIASIWKQVQEPGGYLDYSAMWSEATNFDISCRPSATFPGAVDVDLS